MASADPANSFAELEKPPENMPMMIQKQDGALTKGPGHRTHQRKSYYAVVPASVLDRENTVIDELIDFAFETLGAWCLNVRVYDEAATKIRVRGEH